MRALGEAMTRLVPLSAIPVYCRMTTVLYPKTISTHDLYYIIRDYNIISFTFMVVRTFYYYRISF